MKYKLAPSILSADFAHLAREIALVESADMLHVDVMDGHFVPNLTLGPPVVASLRKVTNLTLDVHLMVTNPIELLDDYLNAGADILTLHREVLSDEKLISTIKAIRANGRKAGLTLRPSTPLDAILPFIGDVDMLLVMSVEPGFGGAAFIPESLQRIRTLREETDRRGLPLDIEVDGGIKLGNIREVREAGANVFVVGSGIFAASDPESAVEEFRAALVAETK